jgi:hypothetical protein
MRGLACVALLASSCSPVIKNLSDCDQVQGEKRIECGLCLAPNKADGWLGTYEYRPESAEGQRCVRVK